MPITVSQVLEWIGITDAAQKRAVTADLAPNPEKFSNLIDETQEGIKDVCDSYTKLEQDSFRLPRSVIKRLVSLMLWAKDCHRLDEGTEFPNGTTKADCLALLDDARVRDELRKSQVKAGKALIASEFVLKLKNRSQWERWSVELKSTLNSIIGSKGIPISYVIRENQDAELDGHATWELKAYHGANLAGPQYRMDCKLVHQIIIRNIAEESDAYTYVKSELKNEDGRKDILALRKRYENQAVLQERINEANRTLTSLAYKNERSLTFERFSSKLQKAIDTLNECERAPHNGDIVDSLWGRIQNAELQPYVQALKVQYSQNPRSYNLILQDIASQIPTLARNPGFRRNVSECGTEEMEVTRDGDCPKSGAITPNGKLYIGNYPGNKWNDSKVRPYHKRINDARARNPVGNRGGGSGNRRGGKYGNRKGNAKRKIAQLTAEIKSLKGANNATAVDIHDQDGKKGPDVKADSSNAFGGRSSKNPKNI